MLMLLAVAAWLPIFREPSRAARPAAGAEVVSVVNLTRAALIAARPEQRRELLAELSDREGIHIYPAETTIAIEPPPPTALSAPRRTRTAASSSARKRASPRCANGEPGLFVSFRIVAGDEGDYWLALPRERIERAFPLAGSAGASRCCCSRWSAPG